MPARSSKAASTRADTPAMGARFVTMHLEHQRLGPVMTVELLSETDRHLGWKKVVGAALRPGGGPTEIDHRPFGDPSTVWDSIETFARTLADGGHPVAQVLSQPSGPVLLVSRESEATEWLRKARLGRQWRTVGPHQTMQSASPLSFNDAHDTIQVDHPAHACQRSFLAAAFKLARAAWQADESRGRGEGSRA